ncbi:MAG: 2-C-methyl-D-erythritol 2,4-cyclodiphosphate synthase [Bacteroidetes bacterium]|nr:2-C-methyl-D-erythritol 2,4-cyclodiphosphate synthase [bacterium]NBP63080.1 2-C-methyl-D-erythritol 2,4-cyclodiphosphate synthase [Bacteroidota bacterium]
MIGIGYDVHRLAEGESLVLGGVTIDSSMGSVAHSDGDVVLHALCDALLGAAGLGDIGEHFPDTDPRWKNAPSRMFVEHAIALLSQHGYSPVNIDITLILEAPKIKPYKDAMRNEIASMTGLPVQRISIKATTNEMIGFAGRKEGVAALCACMIKSGDNA